MLLDVGVECGVWVFSPTVQLLAKTTGGTTSPVLIDQENITILISQTMGLRLPWQTLFLIAYQSRNC